MIGTDAAARKHQRRAAESADQKKPGGGCGAGAAPANFRSAEVEGVAGETRRRMSEARSAEFALPPPRRPPPRAARSEAQGRECRRRAPPRPRNRITAAPSPTPKAIPENGAITTLGEHVASRLRNPTPHQSAAGSAARTRSRRPKPHTAKTCFTLSVSPRSIRPIKRSMLGCLPGLARASSVCSA